MIRVYEAKQAAVENVLQAVRRNAFGATTIVVRRELGACPELLYFSLFLSLKAFQNGSNCAKTIELEWLCRLACEHNVSTAIRRTAARQGDGCAIAIAGEIPKGEWQELGITREMPQRGCDEGFVAGFYGLGKAGLENYPAAALACEKMAISAAAGK